MRRAPPPKQRRHVRAMRAAVGMCLIEQDEIDSTSAKAYETTHAWIGHRSVEHLGCGEQNVRGLLP